MSEINLPKAYDYKVKIWISTLVSTFMVALGLFVFYLAYANQNGMVMDQLFTLNVQQTSWAIAAFGALLLYIGYGALQGLRIRNNADRKVVLTSTDITVPKSLSSKKIVTINFAKIHLVKMIKRSGQTFIRINHSRGYLNIAAQGLSSADFIELYQILITKYKND